jgi:hypothetical protein
MPRQETSEPKETEPAGGWYGKKIVDKHPDGRPY